MILRLLPGCLWPALLVLPLAGGIVIGIDLSPCGGWVTKVQTLDDFWFDDYHAEVLPRDWVFQILDLCAELEVLVVIWCISPCSWWWCPE